MTPLLTITFDEKLGAYKVERSDTPEVRGMETEEVDKVMELLGRLRSFPVDD